MSSAVILVALFCGVAVSGCGSSDAGAIPVAASPVPVSVMKLTQVSSIEQSREFTGTIVASRRTQLAFERSARLTKVNFDDGDSVNKNEVLATLDVRQLKVQIEELKARLDQQKAVLDELNAGPRAETIAATKAELAALEADVELKKSTMDRSENLYRRDATSAQALDEKRLAYRAAVARADALRKQLEELEAGSRVEQVRAQQAMVLATEAQLESLNIALEDSELKAPFAGTIVRRMQDEGDMLAPQQPVFEILETEHLEARIGVPPQMAGALSDSEYVVLQSDQAEFTARLREILPQVDPVTRTQLAVFTVDSPRTTTVADGQLVRLKLDTKIDVDGFRIPVSSLSSGSRGLWNVYVLNTSDPDDEETWVADARVVEVVHSDGEWAVVRGAIYADEQIIPGGIHRIVPGQLVTIANAEQE